MQLRCGVAVHRGHNVLAQLNNRHLNAQFVQVFGNFNADVPAADHHDAFGGVFVAKLFDGKGVGDVAQGKHLFAVKPGQGQVQRLSARRKQQLVVAFFIGAAVCQQFHRHFFGLAVNGNHLVAGAHIHPKTVKKALRCWQGQFGFFTDDVADVIRQAAVCKRDVIATLE
ncbi:hypothetical protein SDC9_121697 [bioreactor metagenome]|uniref:Uncharacterized protein n=1 Tax=bioreactor metagenome TaxID=1076179 RepID=A0A645CCT8_9ZZZZ